MALPRDVRPRARLDEQRRPALVARLSELLLLLAAALREPSPSSEVRDEAD